MLKFKAGNTDKTVWLKEQSQMSNSYLAEERKEMVICQVEWQTESESQACFELPLHSTLTKLSDVIKLD